GLGFEDVWVPAWAAGFSAFGCGAADYEYRYDMTLDINVPDGATEGQKAEAAGVLQRAWSELQDKVTEEFVKNGFSYDDIRFRLSHGSSKNLGNP
ncbi:5-oxoprolinase (ATP-hydrolyzing), partial [Caldalkalibacillus thermarum TA2.A1]